MAPHSIHQRIASPGGAVSLVGPFILHCVSHPFIPPPLTFATLQVEMWQTVVEHPGASPISVLHMLPQHTHWVYPNNTLQQPTTLAHNTELSSPINTPPS